MTTPEYPTPLGPDAGDAILPMDIDVPQAALDDLKARLANTRWPDEAPVDDWSQGLPVSALRPIVEHWRHRYDWRDIEKRLNALPHFRTSIDGLSVHFIHVCSPHENATPLIMTHGWPGSVLEFLDVIGPLTDPVAHGGKAEDAFHLVLPSLPGYGFSDKPRETGWGIERIGKAWGELMRRLGYDRYFAQGGDWGSMVTRVMARDRVEGLAGMHVNLMVVPPPADADMSEPEAAKFAEAMGHYTQWDMGYAFQQRTRPQTLGYGLADSPVGQAGWILEKFAVWTGGDAPLANAFSMDRLLDNVTLYWLTNSAASSARLYWESYAGGLEAAGSDLPAAASLFSNDIAVPPRKWVERLYSDIRYWNHAERGGHFAAMEQPEIFVRELRSAFAEMR